MKESSLVCHLQVLILKRKVHPLNDWWCVGGRMRVSLLDKSPKYETL